MTGRGPPISRRELEEGAGPNVVRDAWYKAEIRPVEIRGVPALAKDYGRRPALWRLTVGRFVIGREVSIYRALAGLSGIPRLIGRIDAFAFAVERVSGTEVAGFKRGTLPPGFLDRLTDVVDAMHRRGVVHGDLRQRRNVLVDRAGQPKLIDFASGVRLPPGSFLHGLACVADLSGVAKLREKHAPDTLSGRERKLLHLERFRPLRRARRRRREKAWLRRKEERRRRRESCEG